MKVTEIRKNIIALTLGLMVIILASQNVSIDNYRLNKGHSVKKPQEKFNEGYIVLQVSNSSLKEATNTVITYFKNHKIRSESTSVTFNGAGEIHTIILYDSKTKEFLTLIDHPLEGKQYIYNKKIWSEEEIERFIVIKGDKEKNILGYACQQFLIKTNDERNDSVIFEIYVTDEINSEVSNAPELFKNKIKGFLLYTKITSVSSNGETIESIREVVKIVNEPLPDDMFSLIPTKEYTNSNH